MENAIAIRIFPNLYNPMKGVFNWDSHDFQFTLTNHKQCICTESRNPPL